jgi:hypothetical protein
MQHFLYIQVKTQKKVLYEKKSISQDKRESKEKSRLEDAPSIKKWRQEERRAQTMNIRFL